MAKTNWQDPKSTEIRSTHISGLQDAVGKIEDALGMKTVTETGIPLTEVYISDSDRYRIFQAPAGKRNWVSSPTPVIKKNGVVISTGLIIDYGGGAIILSPRALATDVFTADVTYMTSKVANDTKKLAIIGGIGTMPDEAAYSPVSVVVKGRTEPKPVVYGASWNKGSDPTLTRTDKAVGKIANVGVDSEIVQNDFDNAAIYRDIHEVTDILGNVFVRIPKCYIRKTDTENLKTWQISTKKFPGFYLPWCFWDFDKNCELPYVDVGKFKGTLGAENKLESKPDLYPLINKNIVDFRNYARNNNVDGLKGYQQLDMHTYDMLQTLFYIEFATLNSQSIMRGYTEGQYANTHLATVTENNTNRIIVVNSHADLYRVGQAISVGTSQGGNQIFYGRTIIAIEVYDAVNKSIVFDGDTVNITTGNMLYNTGWKNGFSSGIAASSGSLVSNSDGKYPCAYRGIESLYGDTWQFVDGVNINDYQAWVALNANDYTSNVFANPYKQLGYINKDVDGYVKQMGFDHEYPFAEFPVEVGGSSVTYYSDNYYRSTGQRIARVGGSWRDGAGAGLSYWALIDASSDANVHIGGRLLKKPL